MTLTAGRNWLQRLSSSRADRRGTRRRPPSRRRHDRAMPIFACQALEDRTLLTATFSIQSAYLTTTSYNAVTTPAVGTVDYVRLDYTVQGLPADGTFTLLVSIDGDSRSQNESRGAGVTGSPSYFDNVGSWVIKPGQHTVQAEIDYFNNPVATTSFNFTPVTLGPELVAPLAGTAYKDFSIVNYNDLDPSGGTLDYTGATGDAAYTYDGHDALDITLANFAAMDKGVPVYAAAAGTVIEAHDGEFDRNTSKNVINPPVNYIDIDLGSGWELEYYHLREGSVMVHAGDHVQPGQQIGLVGSSGDSTDAHLHFAVYHEGQNVETYVDPQDYWLDPTWRNLPYSGDVPGVLDSGITNYDPTPDMKERPADMTTFNEAAGQTVYFWAREHGIQPGHNEQVDWTEPDGSELGFEVALTSGDHYGTFVSSQSLPANAEAGTWTVTMKYDGTQVAQQTFQVNAAGAPAIEVFIGATYILDNRTTPMDIGEVAQGQTPATETFAMLNHGTATLDIGTINLPTGYSMKFPLTSSTILPGDNAEFTVQLDSTTPGTKTGQITFTTNDPEEPNFAFNITGKVDPTAHLSSAFDFSTYLGSTGFDQGLAIASDSDGDTYVAGVTTSSNFPTTPGAYQTAKGDNSTDDQDAFLVKFDPSGKLLWSTYFGGDGNETVGNIAADSLGNVYLVGSTNSTNLAATTSAYQTARAGDTDGYIAKFNAAGSSLLYFTFFGGSGDDDITGVAVSPTTFNIYVTGWTKSLNFPLLDANQDTFGGDTDGFLAEIDPFEVNTDQLFFSTYIGGTGDDTGQSIALDPWGNVYVAGNTTSPSFPDTTTNSVPLGNLDVFLAEYAPWGAYLSFTYLGGSGDEIVNADGLAVDSKGDAYVVAPTTSTDINTFGGIQSSPGSAFLVKYDLHGDELVSTYLNGAADGVALDHDGNVWVEDNTAARVYDPTVAVLRGTVTFGGLFGYGISTDANSDVYIVGETDGSHPLQTFNAYQPNYAGGTEDAYVVRVTANGALQQPSVTNATTTDNTQTTSGLVVTPNAADAAFVTNFQVTNITGGTLFKNDGTTVINNGDFITVAEGAAGLKFTPATNSLASGSFTVQESTTATTAGLGGPTATATITVNLALHQAAVTNATTNDNTQTTAGLIITPNTADTAFVTNFQITNITGGTLFKNDGTTVINNGDFITLAEGAAGLKFTPATNSLAAGSFTVQESTTATTAGLGGPTTTATITVNLLLHPAAVTTATTNENKQTTSGLVITPNAADTAFVTNFQITNITGGTLFLNNGTTPVNNGEFITVAQGAAGLKFTPGVNSTVAGSFTVQESTSATAAGLGGPTAAPTIALQGPLVAALPAASVNFNGPLVFSVANGNAITIIDPSVGSSVQLSAGSGLQPSAGSSLQQLSLAVTHGTLTLASKTGITIVSGANGSASMTLKGTLANLNAALNGLKFTPTTNYFGAATLSVSYKNLGNNQTVSVTVALTVNPPASTPQVTLKTLFPVVVPGQPVPVLILISDTNLSAQLSTFTLSISFGDGTTKTLSSKLALLINHVYTTTGTFPVTVTATDEYGHVSQVATLTIKVVPVAVETNPFNKNQTAIFVGGTTGNDTVIFTPGQGGIAVTVDGVSEGVYSTNGPLVVFGQGGKDVVNKGAGLTNPVDLLQSPTASNVRADLDNEAIQWAGLSAALAIQNL
jgi:Peptidase family M23/Beta-propeller repeat/PKD domain